MNLAYTYGGLVENNKDPLKLGRLKVRVPHVYGSTGGGSGFVATNDLPWALPAGMPAGGSARSGGFSQLPETGDKVWVRFLDGEPEKPVWEWGMQSYTDAETLKLHSYKTGTDGSVGAPDRTAWTRYSHAIELNEGGIIATTSGGYRVLLNDSTDPFTFDGSIKLSTALGNMLEIDDLLSTCTLNILNDVNFIIGTSFLAASFDYVWNTVGNHSTNVGADLSSTCAGAISFTSVGAFVVDSLAAVTIDAGAILSLIAGTDLSMKAGGIFSVISTGALNMLGTADVNVTSWTQMNLTSTGVMSLNYSMLALGITPSEPFVLGNQILAFLTAFYDAYTTHTHAVPGITSGLAAALAVPTTVPAPVPSSTLLSTTIFGR